MADGRIIIDTELDSKGAEKGVSGLGGKLSSVAKTGLKAFTGLITGAGTALGVLGGIGVKYNSEMEQYMSSFTTMLGSAEKATNHLNDLKEFAAKTPFELGDLAKASTTLQAFGTDVKDINPTLKMLGDISLGNKEKFNGLALVFGQVSSQGKLTGQDLMQMINNGFNPLQIMSEKTGKSMSQLKDEMSKGQISFEDVSEAMKIATSEGGKFYNAMEGQSKTLVGQWSTLKDNAKSLLGDMFKPISDTLTNNVLPAINTAIEEISASFANGELQDSVNRIAEGFGNLAASIADGLVEWLPKIIEGFAWILDNSNTIATGIVAIGTALITLNVANMIMGLVKAFKGVKTATEAWLVIQKLLNIELLANPIGLIIAAIAGLVAGIIILWNTNEGFRNAVTNAWNVILNAGKVVWGWLVNFFTVDIPAAWQTVVDFFLGIPAWFSNLWGNIKQAFLDGWQSIVNFFTVTIPSWIEQVFNWFNELPAKIGYALGYTLAAIIKWGLDTWNYLVTNVPIWIENVVRFFSELPGKLWTWLVNAITKIVTWGTQTYNTMVNSVTNAINAVINWFATLPSRIWEWLCNTISKVAQFASNLGSKAAEAGSNMVSNIVDAVADLPSQMLDVGVNIVKGVWKGITSMGSWIGEKVSGFFKGIVKGAKDALGIHSPSRVFRDQVGKYMAQGVGVGFEDETENIKRDMKESLRNLTAKMRYTVDYETAKASKNITAKNNPNGNSTITNNNDNGVTQNVTIVNPQRTPSENARALKKVGRDLAFGY